MTGVLKMFARFKYLDQLILATNSPQIKVLIGPRRTGKTVLLEQLRSTLRRNGVTTEQIQFYNFNRLANQQLFNSVALFSTINKKIIKEKMNYLFLDELENVDNFISELKQLATLSNVDIYITASTATILTKLELIIGRCQLIPIFPLSFSEYLNRHHWSPSKQRLYQYLNEGGYPFSQEIHNEASRTNYIEGVISTTIITALSKYDQLCQPTLTLRLAKLLATQIGQPLNVSQAVNYLQASGIKVSNKTLAHYLSFLQETMLFLPCFEYDLIHDRLKSTNVKYYPIDFSVKTLLTNQRNTLSKANLETLIFLELLSWNYQVTSGRLRNNHISFIATKDNTSHYLHFVYSLPNQKAYHTAITGLKRFADNAPCTLLVAKKPTALIENDPAIPIVPLLDWLTQSK